MVSRGAERGRFFFITHNGHSKLQEAITSNSEDVHSRSGSTVNDGDFRNGSQNRDHPTNSLTAGFVGAYVTKELVSLPKL